MRHLDVAKAENCGTESTEALSQSLRRLQPYKLAGRTVFWTRNGATSHTLNRVEDRNGHAVAFVPSRRDARDLVEVLNERNEAR